MKKLLLRIFLLTQFLLVPLFITGVFADPPGPPGPGGDPLGNGGIPVGGPIEDGIGILLALGLAYGCYKNQPKYTKLIYQADMVLINDCHGFGKKWLEVCILQAGCCPDRILLVQFV